MMRRLFMVAVLVVSLATKVALGSPVTVTLQINDSYVKDKVIANVGIGVAIVKDGPFIVSGTTDAKGQLVLSLEPGDYLVTYKASGYVPIEKSPIHVGSTPMTLTTTLTMLMEVIGTGNHTRIQILLNWGSRSKDHVEDVDAHLLCPCKAETAHTYFDDKMHEGEGHSAVLDVDDTDWGGPETITITDPVPGAYHYWVWRATPPTDVYPLSKTVGLIQDAPPESSAQCWSRWTPSRRSCGMIQISEVAETNETDRPHHHRPGNLSRSADNSGIALSGGNNP